MPVGRLPTARIHIGNARPYVVFSVLARFLRHEGYEPSLVINLTDVNDKIYDAARKRGVPSAQHAEEMIAAYVADTDGLGLGRPDHEPKATETIGADHRPDRGADRARPRLRVRRRRLLQGAQLPRLRPALEPRPRSDGSGRGGRQRRAQGGPARLRPVEGAEAGRGRVLAEPLGRGQARLAHRVLGDGRGAARHSTSPSMAAAPTSSSRTTRTRPRRPRRAEVSLWRGSGCTTGWSRPTPRRRCRSRSATSSCSARRSRRYGGETVVAFLLSGHYRQPLRFGSEPLEQARAANERIREALRSTEPVPAGADGPDPRVSELRETFLAALADDFNTPRALAAVHELVGEINRRSPAGGHETLSGVARSARARRARRDRGRGPDRRRPRRCLPSATPPALTVTSPAPTRSATSSRRSAGRSATQPRARDSSRARAEHRSLR